MIWDKRADKHHSNLQHNNFRRCCAWDCVGTYKDVAGAWNSRTNCAERLNHPGIEAYPNRPKPPPTSWEIYEGGFVTREMGNESIQEVLGPAEQHNIPSPPQLRLQPEMPELSDGGPGEAQKELVMAFAIFFVATLFLCSLFLATWRSAWCQSRQARANAEEEGADARGGRKLGDGEKLPLMSLRGELDRYMAVEAMKADPRSELDSSLV